MMMKFKEMLIYLKRDSNTWSLGTKMLEDMPTQVT